METKSAVKKGIITMLAIPYGIKFLRSMIRRMARTMLLWIVCLAAALTSCNESIHYDIWSLNSDGDTIYYNIIGGGKELEVTNKDLSGGSYRGDIRIPKTVTADDTNYEVVSIGDMAFLNCHELMSVELPQSIRSIGLWAFFDCDTLSHISIPKKTGKIGRRAFGQCHNLAHIEVEKDNPSYVSIDGVLFDKGMTTILLYPSMKPNTIYAVPSTVKSIGDWSFYKCKDLCEIYLPEDLKTIGRAAFYSCHNLQSMPVPESVSKIGSYAFYECDNMTSTNIPNQIKTVEAFTYCRCRALTELRLPVGLEKIGNSAFRFCDNLLSMVVPEGVKEIDEYTFNGYKSMTSIVLPKELERIGHSSFDNCVSLPHIDLPPTLKEIDDGAFYECKIMEDMIIPRGVTRIGSDAFRGCYKLAAIEVEEGNEEYISIDGVLFDKDMKTLMRYPHAKADTLYEVPSSVRTIKNHAFSTCRQLKEIILPDQLEEMGEHALNWNTELKRVNIPSHLRTIKAWTFYQCRALDSIEIPASVDKIEKYAFHQCRSLKVIRSHISKPFTINVNTFMCDSIKSASDTTMLYHQATLYVPKGTSSKYRKTSSWGMFDEIKEE